MNRNSISIGVPRLFAAPARSGHGIETRRCFRGAECALRIAELCGWEVR